LQYLIYLYVIAVDSVTQFVYLGNSGLGVLVGLAPRVSRIDEVLAEHLQDIDF
jgi:hypothetical protein